MTINIALTGPPSAGKTSVIRELNQMLKNVNIYQEISRKSYKDQLKQDQMYYHGKTHKGLIELWSMEEMKTIFIPQI